MQYLKTGLTLPPMLSLGVHHPLRLPFFRLHTSVTTVRGVGTVMIIQVRWSGGEGWCERGLVGVRGRQLEWFGDVN